MGNWAIHIEGTGAHHSEKLSDADELLVGIIRTLRSAGQDIETATFTSGSRYAYVRPRLGNIPLHRSTLGADNA